METLVSPEVVTYDEFLVGKKITAGETPNTPKNIVPEQPIKYSDVGLSAMINGHEVPKLIMFLEERVREDFGWQPYSFVQVKRFSKKAATVGFIATLAITGTLLGGYTGWLSVREHLNINNRLGSAKIVLSKLPPPPSQTADPLVAPPPPTTADHGPAARAGTPVPVPDALVAPDVKDFANIDQISRASTKGGDGVDTGFLGLAGDDIKVEVRDDEDTPGMYEFLAVEKEPYLDIKDLQSRVEYPEVARRANIQGKVLVRVLVGKNGVPMKTVVEASDSDLLDPAATKAIMKSVFTPALQNGHPVTCWVSIPVIFVIK
ncbi:MAG: TonB family protein [Candidatus Kapabacteria bacterium]|nr:TonB family protein [Candidatus Kapabacteria bacterium]